MKRPSFSFRSLLGLELLFSYFTAAKQLIWLQLYLQMSSLTGLFVWMESAIASQWKMHRVLRPHDKITFI
jgi:hypothetical protein